jgi:hypothetical protein
MASALQKYNVPTAFAARSSAPLPGIGLPCAMVLVQGSKLEANLVLRLSLDLPDDQPQEKAA